MSCSSRGLFNLTTSRCECTEEGWESFGDFAFDYSDCDLFTPALRAEWTATILVQLVSCSLGMYYFDVSRKRSDSGLTLMCVLNVIACASFSTLGGLKISDPPGAAVGYSVPATILYCIGSATVWTCMGTGAYEVMKVSAGIVGSVYPDSSLMRNLSRLKRIVVTLSVANVFFSFAPCLMLNGHQNFVYLASALHGMGLGFSMIALGVWLIPLFSIPASKLLQGARTESHRIGATEESMRKIGDAFRRLRFTSFVAMQQGLMQFAIAVPFSLVPVVVRKVSYNFPLAWMLAGIMSSILVVILGQNLRGQKMMRHAEIDNDKNNNVSSLYIGTNAPFRPHPPPASAVSRDGANATVLREHTLLVDNDTIISRLFGRQAANRAIRRYMNSPLNGVAEYVAKTTSLIVVPLVMMEVISPYVAVVTGVFSGLHLSLATCVLINQRVFSKLMRHPPVLLRQFVIFTWIVSLGDVLGWDARCVVILTLYFYVPISLNFDAFVGGMKRGRNLEVRLMVWSVTAFPLIIFILLQFDFLPRRRNRQINYSIEGYQVVSWSVYQVCLNANLAVLMFMVKDGWASFRSRGTNWLTYIHAPVRVKIIGLNLLVKNENSPQVVEAAAEGVSEEARKAAVLNVGNAKRFDDWSTMGVSRMKLTEGMLSFSRTRNGREANNDIPTPPMLPQTTTTTAFVDVIVLRESDALVVRWVGVKRGRAFLAFRGDPIVSFASFFVLAVPFVVWIVFVLPGLVDARWSYLTAVCLVPELVQVSLNSRHLLGLLVRRVDFAFESLAAASYLVIFARLLRFDVRAFPLPIVFLLWFQQRTNDARCVYFHAGPRGRLLEARERADRRLRFLRILHVILAIILAASIVALPVILSVGIVAGGASSLNETVILRHPSTPIPISNGVNLSQIDYEWSAPPCTFANVVLLQFVSDFTVLLAVNVSLEIITDAVLRSSRGTKKKSMSSTAGRVRLKYFNAPVRPTYDDEEGGGRIEKDVDAMNAMSEVVVDDEEGEINEITKQEAEPRRVEISSFVDAFGRGSGFVGGESMVKVASMRSRVVVGRSDGGDE